jgi:hypothetical protein
MQSRPAQTANLNLKGPILPAGFFVTAQKPLKFIPMSANASSAILKVQSKQSYRGKLPKCTFYADITQIW